MLLIGQCDGTYPGRLSSDTVATLVLVATTEQHFNVPANGYVAVFAATGNFFVLTNGQTASVPTVSNTSFPTPNTNAELNPAVLSVTPGALMSVIAPAACNVTISFYMDEDRLDFQSQPLVTP